MDMRGSVMAGLARQLGRPSGLRGRFVGVMLNRSNKGSVTAAVEDRPVGEDEEAFHLLVAKLTSPAV